MAIAGFILYGLGMLVMIVGGIMFLVAAFRTGILWGLATMFLPFAGFLFLCMHWDAVRRSFLVQFIGFLIACGGLWAALAGAGHAAGTDDGGAVFGSLPPGIADKLQTGIQPLRDAIESRASARKMASAEEYLGLPVEDVKRKLGRPQGEMTLQGKSAFLYEHFTLLSEDGATITAVQPARDYEPIPTEPPPPPVE